MGAAQSSRKGQVGGLGGRVGVLSNRGFLSFIVLGHESGYICVSYTFMDVCTKVPLSHSLRDIWQTVMEQLLCAICP